MSWHVEDKDLIVLKTTAKKIDKVQLRLLINTLIDPKSIYTEPSKLN